MFRLAPAVVSSVLLTTVFVGMPAAAQNAGPYEGHKVVRVRTQNPIEMARALALTDDVWTCEPHPGKFLDVRMSPGQYAALAELGIEHDVIIEDVQALLDAEWARLQQPGNPEAGWYEEYKTYDEIMVRIDDLVAAHGAIASKSSIGQTLEGRDIPMVRVKGTGGPTKKPIVFINGCQHAREWASPMSVMFTMEHLLTQYGVDPRVTDLLNAVEFAFVPMVNGDGYAYTWTPNNRLWRKNRRDNGGGCFGVDLNRNWDAHWGQSGASSNPCNDTYRGAAAFSEPETAALRDALDAIKDDLRVHVDVHTYGQWILHPWGWTTSPSPDETFFMEIGQDMAAAIASVHGKVYTPGQSSILLYLVSGGSKDYTYDVLGRIGWTFELRPIGSPGFVLPPEEIIPTGEEYLESMLVLGERIARPLIMHLKSPPPSTLATSQTYAADLRVYSSAGDLKAGSVVAMTRSGSTGSFAATAMNDAGGGWYTVDLQASGTCKEQFEVYFQAETTSGEVATLPDGGAAAPFLVTVLASEAAFEDDLEDDQGWIVGAPGDDATTGIWTRNDPQGTAAQPEDDHTPAPGVNCWVTDYRAGTSIGQYDVDGGKTTLTSPLMDASDVFDIIGDDPHVSYWRWYSNDQGGSPNQDSMPVLISNDDGQTWVELENVTENANAWVFKEFRIADFVTPTDQIRLRFVARDLDPGSIVEAAVDDVRLMIYGCPRHPADMNADGVLDLFDFLEFSNLFNAKDPLADFDKNGVFDLFDFLAFVNAFNK